MPLFESGKKNIGGLVTKAKFFHALLSRNTREEALCLYEIQQAILCPDGFGASFQVLGGNGA